MRRRSALAATMLLALAVFAAAAAAQDARTAGPGWAGDPSPLPPVGELVRTGAPVPSFPLLLTAPAVRAGLHWTFGNPGALPFELDDERAEFQLRQAAETGEYHRPLDPARARQLTASGSGWRTVGGAGAVRGGVGVERASLDGLSANLANPHGMSPHVYGDTSGTPLGRTGARLEGAGGWRLGDWGLGLAAGYETWSTRTDLAQVPRFQRGVMPGVTAGITRALGSRGLLLGVHGRWQAQVQMNSVSARTGGTSVFPLEGHMEPSAVDLSPPAGFLRRIERDGGAAGLGASIAAVGIRWVALGEVMRLSEKQTSLLQNDPPFDRWDATGHTVGLAAEGGLPRGLGRFVAGIRWTRLAGDASREAIEEEGSLFDATEEVVDAGIELRLEPWPGWQVAARGALAHEHRVRDDLVADVGWSLRVWRPAASLEAARELGRGLALGIGGGMSRTTPIGSLPNPNSLGPNYQQWLAPELAYYATPALSGAFLLSARWRTPGGSVLTLEGQYTSTSPRHAFLRMPFVPEGDRRAWQIALRVLR